MRWVMATVSVVGVSALAIILSLFLTGHQSTDVSVYTDVTAAVIDTNSGETTPDNDYYDDEVPSDSGDHDSNSGGEEMPESEDHDNESSE